LIITNVEVIPAGYMGTFQPPRRRAFALVAITTDDGSTGWGEASDCYGHTHPLTVRAVVEEDLKWFLLGRPIDSFEATVAGLRQRVYPFLGGRELVRQAISGIEIALWDLRGKLHGQSLATMLGQRRDAVPIYASGQLVFHQEPADYVTSFTPALERGVAVAKVRLGKDMAWDRAWVTAMRQLLPDDVQLLADGKYNYSPDSAVAMSRLLADNGYIAFEEPVHDCDLGAVADAARRAPVPFAYGEHAFGVEGFRELVDAGVSILNPDVTVCGGVAETIRIAELAAERGRAVMPHCGGLSAVGLAANIHVAAAFAEPMALEYDIQPLQPLRDEILADGAPFAPDRLVAGALAVPLGPGLGVDVDRVALARFPYEIDREVARTLGEYASPHI
jgi:L-alanine-DL-glutamate epimerase-like enolase superfamily enzyme